MSIGARSQSAKTYLEKHFESFAECKMERSFLLFISSADCGLASLEELIVHGLHALRETLQQDKELTIQNTSIGIVGPPSPGETTRGVTSTKFRILEGDAIDVFLKKLPVKEVSSGAATGESEDVEMQI